MNIPLLRFLALLFLFPLAQGCLATQNWVTERLNPMGQKLSDTENRLGQTDAKLGKVEGRVSGAEGQISNLDGRVSQADSKAEKALGMFANLRLQRKLVLTLKEGANFNLNSSVVRDETKREIDGFLSDLKSDLKEADSAVFLVAGHADNTGSDDYNYDLGTRRASSVAKYLISKKGIDPTRVVTVSYGETSPLEDNTTRDGRQKNRRVEILVYNETISTAGSGSSEQSASLAPAPASAQTR